MSVPHRSSAFLDIGVDCVTVKFLPNDAANMAWIAAASSLHAAERALDGFNEYSQSDHRSEPFVTSPDRSRTMQPAFLGLVVALVMSGCGHGLFGWTPFTTARPPDPVAVAVDVAWLERSDVPHVSAFYDALAPHGLWTEDPALGWIWAPSDAEYVPYAQGRWVETEAGPTFLCDAPHGWATAHYGRWLHRDRWYWVPGTRWGPAWVSWRVGRTNEASHDARGATGGMSDPRGAPGGAAGGSAVGAGGMIVGWAPLGPDTVSWAMPEGTWQFVAMNDLTHPQVTTRTYPPSDELWLMTHTRPIARAAQAEVGGFVVGPEVRFAGWRAHKVPLERLPQARVRWVPRYERPERPPTRVEPKGVRAAPAASQRFGRKALIEHAPTAPRKDPERDRRDRQRAPRTPRTF